MHRIGRTGRVGRQGRAVTFVEPKQTKELEAIERHIKTELTPWAPGAKTKAAKVVVDAQAAAAVEPELLTDAEDAPVVVTPAPEAEVTPEAAPEAAPAAKRAPRARPRRHVKPQINRPADEPYARLVAGVGTADGLQVADLVAAVTRSTGLDGEAVRDVKVLTQFSLLSVPQSEATRVVSDLTGVEVVGTQLRVALARS